MSLDRMPKLTVQVNNFMSVNMGPFNNFVGITLRKNENCEKKKSTSWLKLFNQVRSLPGRPRVHLASFLLPPGIVYKCDGS